MTRGVVPDARHRGDTSGGRGDGSASGPGFLSICEHVITRAWSWIPQRNSSSVLEVEDKATSSERIAERSEEVENLMEYDYGRSGSGGYDSGRPMYPSTSRSSSGNSSSPQGSSFSHYPRIEQGAGASSMGRAPPPPPLLSSPSFSSGAAIRVSIKPMYRVAPPPQLRMQSREVPRSLFQFDFDLERRILAGAESQGNPHLRESSKSQSNGDANLAEVEDATVAKYLAMGHNKEAVQYALQNFGDDQTKILDFCPAYYKIRDMGFPADRVARALAQHNNDEEQAILALVGGTCCSEA